MIPYDRSADRYDGWNGAFRNEGRYQSDAVFMNVWSPFLHIPRRKPVTMKGFQKQGTIWHLLED